MTTLTTTQVELSPSTDYLDRVEAASRATAAASETAGPQLALATFVLAFVLVAASATLGSVPLFVGVAAATVIGAAEVFHRTGVTTPTAL